MNAIQTINRGNKIIEIHVDVDPSNPRDPNSQYNDDVMVCFSRRYKLGDEHSYKQEDYSCWEEMQEQIEKDNDVAEILPLYLYDHSGITISTTDFNDRWDSGQIGFIYITKAKARETHMRKRLTKKTMKQVHKNLLASVEQYDQYLRGDVYGYIIKNKETGEEVDSCWGFFGEKYCVEEAESIA